MPFRTISGKLSAKQSNTECRKTVIEEHRRRSTQLDRARTKACQLQTILDELNETFIETRRQQLLPCLIYEDMDRMLRQALTAYEQLRSEEEDEEEGRLGFAKSTLADDIGNKFDDHLGLVKRIRDRCRQQSDIVRRVMHRETIYQVMTLKELKKDLASVEKQTSRYQAEGDRDEAKLRRMAKAYRASRLRFGLIRYFKLKHIIHDAISELRME